MTLVLAPLLAVAASVMIGRYPISPADAVWAALVGLGLSSRELPETVAVVVFDLRLPRIIAALVIGGALSAAGAAYQGIFRNPLVSPDILGAAAGSGFGAALGIMLGLDVLAIEILAFVCGLAAVAVSYLVALRLKGVDPMLVLVLAGILVGTVFTSLITLLKYLADTYERLPAITFWLMGSLSSVDRADLPLLLVPAVIGLVVLFLLRGQLTTLSFGEDEALTLGVDTGTVRVAAILAATLVTAATVSVCGMIGWVGLVVPHLARALVGPTFGLLLPTSMLLGSTYLLLVDDLARSLGPLELPLGVLTAIVGAPCFLYLLSRTSRGWS